MDENKEKTEGNEKYVANLNGLSKNLDLLTKTKILRQEFVKGHQEFQQHSECVKKSDELQNKNDKEAAKAMGARPAAIPSVKNKTAEQKSGGRPSFRSNRELQEELEAMQELISQLTLDEEVKTRVIQLAKNNPKLKQLNLLPKTNSRTAEVPSTSRDGKKRQDYVNQSANNIQTKSNHNLKQQQDGTKQRHQSEMSNVSVSSTNSQKGSTANTDAELGAKKRRRPRRNKQNNSVSENTVRDNIAPESEASHNKALTKYINSMVVAHLGTQKERAVELQFKGDFNNLEEHAELLVKAGLGCIVEEEIRINRKNNRQSFITMSTDREGPVRDGIITLPVARRFAFDGNIVRAFVLNPSAAVEEDKKKPPTVGSSGCIEGGKEHSFCIADDEEIIEDDFESPPDSDVDANELDTSVVISSDNCPKAFVISIVKRTEMQEVVGTISFKNAVKLNDGESYYRLRPHDMRVPMIYIDERLCHDHMEEHNISDVTGLLYLAQVRETNANGYCIGELVQPVGKAGNLEAELKAILLHNGLRDVRPYEQRFNDLFAQPDPAIRPEDLVNREDLRSKCVFTIDPLTARDLDDAMSVECVGDDLYEVGVHISDVGHYLHEDSELDNIVKDRATSIYLVTEVIHMLPQPLCFKCSLLPGEDKFAFSVFWRMRSNGDIQGKPRFTRSVINSCSQLAYEHAQKIIDNPEEEFDANDLPTICNGFQPKDIASRIRKLQQIAEQLRLKRYEGGALSINNPKLRFNLNPKNGEPLSYEVDGRQEANFLIEEFMLLANQSVARFIHDHYPDISILRNHAPPLSKSMKGLRDKLASVGIDFDGSSSKAVYDSMQRISRAAEDPKAMEAFLSTMLTKPMARAKYFCSEGKTDAADLWHYALSIPIYTHFTSPIRRYPDILVHRLLAAALNYGPAPKRTADELHHMAKVCNDQKFNAKNAGDESIHLFFKRYIRSQQSVILRAVVIEIFQHFVNVVTIETGHNIGISYKLQKVLVDTSNAPAYILISEKSSKRAPLKLQLFSTIDVKLAVYEGKVCGSLVLPDLKQQQGKINNSDSSSKKNLRQRTNDSPSPRGSENGQPKTRHNSQRKQADLPTERSFAVRPNESE